MFLVHNWFTDGSFWVLHVAES